MVRKNDVLTGKVLSFGSDGEGVVRMEECVFFIPYALPGEEIEFRAVKVKGNTGYGKIERILSVSPDRVQPLCPVFHTCGGCLLQHASYECQREFKREKVRLALKKIGGVEAEVQPVEACSSPYGYRNKLQLPVGVDASGKTVIGFYAERSHRIVPIERCAIHPKWSAVLIATFQKYLAATGVKGYDEVTKKGLIRHLVAREIDGEYLITVVATAKTLPQEELLVRLFEEAFPRCSVYINVNKSSSNVIFGDVFKLLCGKGRIVGETGGVKYEAGAETFVQVNPEIREKLYARAIEACFFDGAQTVIDAYSGGGLLTALAAKRAERAYGIELNGEASACADELKKKNGLTNMTNICGDVAEILPEIMQRECGRKIALILDPPRAGVARSVLYAILRSGIERFVMISCNPSTLARDLGILTGSLRERNGELVKIGAESAKTAESTKPSEIAKNAAAVAAFETADTVGTASTAESAETERRDTETFTYFQIDRVEPFDMFPQTKHVETLITLCRK